MAALPALLWGLARLLQAVLPVASPVALGGVSLPGLFSSIILTLFVVDWFRFSLRMRAGGDLPVPAPVPSLSEMMGRPLDSLGRGGRQLFRVVRRIILVVTASTALLLPPTVVLAAGTLALTGQFGNDAALGEAVALALPLAMILASPLLVRFYVYYAALAAGRDDVRGRDVWRWSRGKSLWLLALLALSLAPAVAALTIAGLATGLLAVALYILAIPLLFLSLGVMANVTAGALAGLVLPPVVAGR